MSWAGTPQHSDAATATRGRSSLLLWGTGLTLSLIADQVFTLALTWAVLRTDSPASVAVVVAAVSVSRIGVLLIGGAIADRVSPRRSLITADAGRTVIMAISAALLFAGHYSVATLVVVALLVGILDGLFQPAAFAMPAKIVMGTAIQRRVSAVRTVVRRSSVFLGNIVAGIAVASYDAPGAFVLAALLFAGSVACLPFIRTAVRATDTVINKPSGPRQIFSDVWDGLRVVRSTPGVARVFLMLGMMNIGFVGPITAGIPIMAAHRGWAATGAGWILAAFGLGAGAAGAWLFFRPIRRHTTAIMLVGVALMGITIAGLGIVHTLPAAILDAIALGIASGTSGTASNSITTASLPREHLARTQALYELVMDVPAPLSLAVAGALATAGHADATFIVGGMLTVIGAVAATSSGVRQLEVPDDR